VGDHKIKVAEILPQSTITRVIIHRILQAITARVDPIVPDPILAQRRIDNSLSDNNLSDNTKIGGRTTVTIIEDRTTDSSSGNLSRIQLKEN
jgi:hypothetical protein